METLRSDRAPEFGTLLALSGFVSALFACSLRPSGSCFLVRLGGIFLNHRECLVAGHGLDVACFGTHEARDDLSRTGRRSLSGYARASSAPAACQCAVLRENIGSAPGNGFQEALKARRAGKVMSCVSVEGATGRRAYNQAAAQGPGRSFSADAPGRSRQSILTEHRRSKDYPRRARRWPGHPADRARRGLIQTPKEGRDAVRPPRAHPRPR